jgi:anaerobic ribonucleoside-triphosphate reductase activating protein
MNPFDHDLSLHAVEKNSITNGPGHRLVIWVQGCTLNCPACFNPASHNPNSGNNVKISSLTKQIKDQQPEIEGITISGGEPLQQIEAVSALCDWVKQQTDLGIIVLTGLTYDEARSLPLYGLLTASIDVMIAGRFNHKKLVKSGLRGSSNKTCHFYTDRYTQQQLENTQDSEIIIKPNGEIIVTGIDPLVWASHGS